MMSPNMVRKVKKLYRRDNKKVMNYHGNTGGDYCHSRNTKAMKEFQGKRLGMGGKEERGVDYTPLYKFLLSKVGQSWDDVYSEAIQRLDKKEPIFWMVELSVSSDDMGYVRLGDNSYYSKLTVDETGLLVKVKPNLTKEMMPHSCQCCTHTFNGEIY